MKLKKLNSDREISVNIAKYLIDWDRIVSKPQKAVKDFLAPYWKADCVGEEFLIPGSKLRIDLVNFTNKICVEISPEQHFKFNKFLHGERSKFLNAVKRDVDKQVWCEANGFKFVEITSEKLKNLSIDMFEE